jgi:hypothetical protein
MKNGNSDEIELIRLLDYTVPQSLAFYPKSLISFKIHFFDIECKFICNKFDIKSVQEYVNENKMGESYKDRTIVKLHNDENYYIVKASFKKLKELVFNEKYKTKEIGFNYGKDSNNKTNR